MRLLFLSALLSSALGAVVLAANGQKDTAAGATLPATGPAVSQSLTPINAHCAVERDNAVDVRTTVQHDGKTIGFCCKDCIKDFRKDPEKYVAGLK